MRKLKFTAIVALASLTLMSCGGLSGSQPVNAKDFKAIEEEIKNEFGTDAYYTDLSIGYEEQIGIYVATTVTEKPESLEMGEWNMSQNSWQQSSIVTLEISEGSKASDFMFQLGDKINLEKLGELVEKSRSQLTKEKDIENPALNLAYISFPDNGDYSKAQYVVTLNPENGGTSFSFSYDLEGGLIKMDY